MSAIAIYPDKVDYVLYVPERRMGNKAGLRYCYIGTTGHGKIQIQELPEKAIGETFISNPRRRITKMRFRAFA